MAHSISLLTIVVDNWVRCLQNVVIGISLRFCFSFVHASMISFKVFHMHVRNVFNLYQYRQESKINSFWSFVFSTLWSLICELNAIQAEIFSIDGVQNCEEGERNETTHLALHHYELLSFWIVFNNSNCINHLTAHFEGNHATN